MVKQTKQRIIGAILLVLLAAIIAPLLLRSPDEVRVALDMSLPPPPSLPEIAIEPVVDEHEQRLAQAEIEADREAIRKAGEEAELQARQQQGRPEPAEPVPPAEAPPLSGWAVQAGSFSTADAAEAEAQRLREGGYRAFTRAVVQADKTLHRVFAGPELDRAAAVTLREQLAADQRFGIQGLVISLAP